MIKINKKLFLKMKTNRSFWIFGKEVQELCKSIGLLINHKEIRAKQSWKYIIQNPRYIINFFKQNEKISVQYKNKYKDSIIKIKAKRYLKFKRKSIYSS